MGNFVDKDVAKNRSLPFDPPNSAAALHQFLSKHPKEMEVKMKGAYTAPVLKVRPHKPKELNAESRKAWKFYLLNMQQRLAGTKQADMAREAIEALLKREPLKLSVGRLLGPMQQLMEAEQARLADANSYVKRWLANEKSVLQTAVGHGTGDDYRKEAERDKEALMTACIILSKFSDSQHGEIDTNLIRGQAYEIGRGLTAEDLGALGRARLCLTKESEALGPYIGPEARLLISLCINAHGKARSDFFADAGTKNDVSLITTALRARTDSGEYPVPASPRTIAGRSVRRLSMPVFQAPETTATASTSSTTRAHRSPEKGKVEARSTPPAKLPPSTPAMDGRGNDHSRRVTASITSGSANSGDTTYRRADGMAMHMNAAIHELKHRHTTESDTTGDEGSQLALNSLPATPRGLLSPGPETSAVGTGSSSTSDTNRTTSRKPRPGRQHSDQANRPDVDSPRPKGDGSEMSSPRTRKPKSSIRAKSMVVRRDGDSVDANSSDQKAMAEAGEAARALKAGLLKPQTDSAIYKKWDAAQQQLQGVLTLEMSKAVSRLMSYCHEVDLEQGQAQASLAGVITTLRPSVQEARAFVAVRDLLLAETRGVTSTSAMSTFPELLSLLIFALDANHAWRQEYKSTSSH